MAIMTIITKRKSVEGSENQWNRSGELAGAPKKAFCTVNFQNVNSEEIPMTRQISQASGRE